MRICRQDSDRVIFLPNLVVIVGKSWHGDSSGVTVIQTSQLSLNELNEYKTWEGEDNIVFTSEPLRYKVDALGFRLMLT